jgi:hypothetical protein
LQSQSLGRLVCVRTAREDYWSYQEQLNTGELWCKKDTWTVYEILEGNGRMCDLSKG